MAKITRLRIQNAEPAENGSFIGRLKLQSLAPYFYGNFENSDDTVDLKDIAVWAQLIKDDPEKWSDSNVDGFTGIDLFDASLLQENWGMTPETSIGDADLTYQEVLSIFGFGGGTEETTYTPSWLRAAKNSCSL